jgi:hypothetical protein
MQPDREASKGAGVRVRAAAVGWFGSGHRMPQSLCVQPTAGERAAPRGPWALGK